MGQEFGIERQLASGLIASLGAKADRVPNCVVRYVRELDKQQQLGNALILAESLNGSTTAEIIAKRNGERYLVGVIQQLANAYSPINEAIYAFRAIWLLSILDFIDAKARAAEIKTCASVMGILIGDQTLTDDLVLMVRRRFYPTELERRGVRDKQFDFSAQN